MHYEAQYNLTKMAFSMLLEDAFAYWVIEKDRSFMVALEKSIKKNEVKLEANNIELNLPKREILKTAINSVKSSALVQMLCYVYELVYKNYDPSLSNDKTNFNKIKSNILQSSNNFNNEQLWNLIRDSISHNDDSDNPSYDYSILAELFTFLPTKKKRINDDTSVRVSEEELVNLITIYIKNMNGYRQLDYRLDVNMDKIKSPKQVVKVADFIKLKNLKTNEVILPDEHQKKVIKELIQRIRDNEIREIDNLNFFYPYKQNVLNNFIRISDFYHMLNCLYKLRGLVFDEFIVKCGMYTPSFLSEIKNVGDIGNLFVTNRLFQVFSTTPNQFLQEKLSSTYGEISINRLRNSIMHGTYFKDQDANLYVYDAARPNKTEEKLEYIDTYSLEDLEMLNLLFFVTKYSKTNNRK